MCLLQVGSCILMCVEMDEQEKNRGGGNDPLGHENPSTNTNLKRK